MNKLEKLENITITYSKCLVLFMMCFIPFRNELELLLGTYIKVLPDMMILILLMGYVISQRGRVKIQLSDIIFCLFFLVALINTIFIKKISISIYIMEVRSLAVYYILYVVIRNYKFEQNYILKICKCIRGLTYLLFVLGMIEMLSSKMLLFPKSVAESIIYADNFSRMYGMFCNPNTYGAFLVLTFFFVIYHAKGEKLWVYKCIALASLFMTMSRSSLLIFIFVGILYILIFRKELLENKKALILQIIIVGLISIGIYMLSVVGRESMVKYINAGTTAEEAETTMFDRLKEMNSEEIVEQSNLVGRIFIVKTGIQIWKDNAILGTGFGTYGSGASMAWIPEIYEQYGIPAGCYSDNEYIKDIVETGSVGFLLLCLFLVSILYEQRKKPLNILICIMVGWFGLFYNVFEVQIVAFLLWGYLGVLNQNKKYER